MKCYCCWCFSTASCLLYTSPIHTFNNHQHQPLSQNAKVPSFQLLFSTHHPELLAFSMNTFIIRYISTPLDQMGNGVSFFSLSPTFLDDVVWYAAVYIYVINFIFHFSLESGIMQILNAIFYGYEMCRLGLYFKICTNVYI